MIRSNGTYLLVWSNALILKGTCWKTEVSENIDTKILHERSADKHQMDSLVNENSLLYQPVVEYILIIKCSIL